MCVNYIAYVIGQTTIFLPCDFYLLGRGNFWEKGRPTVKYRDTAVTYAKTAEPIVMPFGLCAQNGPRIMS